MRELVFQAEGVEPILHAATPLLCFKVRVTNRSDVDRVHCAMLRCRVDLDPTRRSHDPRERGLLLDLFDRPERWSRTVRQLLWADLAVSVPAFSGSVLLEIPVPCSGDLELASTRYLFALGGGDLDVALSFRGTAFFDAGDRGLQAAPVAPDNPTHAQLSLRIWSEMLDHYFPNSGWLRVRRDLVDRLARHKCLGGHPTMEQALESLLLAAEGDRCHEK